MKKKNKERKELVQMHIKVFFRYNLQEKDSL